MNTLFLISGLFLVILAAYDLTYTTLAPKGAGLITGKVNHWLWELALKMAGNDGRHSFLDIVGYLLLYIILGIWIIMIWVGNTLIIYSDPTALIDQNHAYVPGFIDKIYYTGYVLSTMGSGDFRPVTSFWKFYAAFISFTGLVFITIAISYIIPVINAVADKRALSAYINSIGTNPRDILIKTYNGQDFKSLETHLTKIHQQILLLIQHHQAYPVLHYFHTTNFHNSASINICSLDEVISILICSVDKEYRPKDSILFPVRRAMTGFFQTLNDAYINPEHGAPAPPDLSSVGKDLPIIRDDEKRKKAFERLSARRKVLQAYLNNDGWKWEEMLTAHHKMELEEENVPGEDQDKNQIT